MSIFSELKRRKVVRMAALYAVTAWLIMQIAEVVIGLAGMPAAVGQIILVVLALGFPIALVISYVYDLTPEGIERDTGEARAPSRPHSWGRLIDFVIIAILAAGLVVAAYDKWWLDEQVEAASIAVLPFANMSGEPNQEYLSDGISEELLHRLAQVSGLHVAARTSAFYFKGKNLPIRDVAEALRVRTVLEGSVRKSGETIRVTAQLIDTETGYHLWSQTVQGNVSDIFAIQDQIAVQVVRSLKVTLLGDEHARLTRQPTENLAAYDAYLLGRQMMARRTSGALDAALEHFGRAISLDEEFALAYVGLGHTYVLLGRYGGMDNASVIAGAEPAIQQALELNDELGEAYTTLGYLTWLKGDPVSAEAAFKRSIELNPSYALAYLEYGRLLGWGLGDKEQALELTLAALGLDPMSTPVNMAVVEAYHELGLFDEAKARCERVIEMDPDYPRAYTIMADLYWEVFGQLDQAVIWLRRATELDPGNPDHARWLGMVFLDLGDLEAGELWMRKAIDMAPKQRDSLWAAVYLGLYTRDAHQAIEGAERLLEAQPDNILAMRVLRDRDYKMGEVERALERYRTIQPGLVDGAEPSVTQTNWWWAIDIARVLLDVGRTERAEKLLRAALSVLETRPRLGYAGFGIRDVEAYALLGERERASAALTRAVRAGWRSSWWLYTEANTNLEALRTDPAYGRVIAEIESEMAGQLAMLAENPESENPLSDAD